MPAASASIPSSATCPSGRRSSSATAPPGPKEKFLPHEQSFSRAHESYLCADTLVSQRIPSQIYSEQERAPLDLPPQRNCARILLCSFGIACNGGAKTCRGARGK